MNKKDISNFIKEIELAQPIKLQISGSENNKPAPIGFSRSEVKFTPDIVADFAHKKDIYAIEKKISDQNIQLKVSKWILFAAEARKAFGTFFLIIPKSKVAYLQKIIAEKKLDIKLIQL